MKIYPYFLLAALLIFSCKQKAEEKEPSEEAAYECDFSEEIKLGENMKCGYVEVPENYQRPEGRKIKIAYVVLKARNTDQENYPLIYFSGGPGGISLAEGSVKRWSEIPINDDRDIILFDQRGINYSTALPDIGPELFEVMAADADVEQEKKQFAEVLKSYQKKFREEGIDIGSYNSFENARDVGELMSYLGYKKYNLFGVSYGTRLARIVQDMFPEKIHSVILDSPAPLNTDFLISRLESYSLSLQRVFDFCKTDPGCSKKYPELKKKYIAAISSLKEKPIEVVIEGKPFFVNAQDAVYFLRRRLYRGDSRENVPAFIMALSKREGEAVIEDINYEKNIMTPFINTSMLLAVENHEQFDKKYTSKVIDSIYKTLPLFPARLGFFTALYEAGQNWHDNRLPYEKRVFNRSDVPTLIFVNQYDPVTPPEYGAVFKERLTNSELYILDQGGHGALNNECGMQVMTDFMNTANKDELDTSCLELYKK